MNCSIAHVLKSSGCDVPEYMLSLKKRSKKERKQLEKSAPKRDDITTKPIYDKLKKLGKERKFKEIRKREKLVMSSKKQLKTKSKTFKKTKQKNNKEDVK